MKPTSLIILVIVGLALTRMAAGSPACGPIFVLTVFGALFLASHQDGKDHEKRQEEANARDRKLIAEEAAKKAFGNPPTQP